MKILAQYNPNSGGSYHRVKLWSEFVEGVTLTEQITEEQIQGCDIVYIHWSAIRVSIPQLSVWREKYQFKLVVDIDDTWDVETKFWHTIFISQHLCLLADHVICSTHNLVDQIKEWNPNVTVIPNLIPFGHGQFSARTHKSYPEYKKLRVGIGGSISHYEDYMSLRGTIKHLQKQKWFQDKCQFVVIGYDGKDPRWRKVVSMFKNPLVLAQKPCESYMTLYEQIDVMLLPLLDTPLNRGRSDLKIYECLAKNVVPVISRLYILKNRTNKRFRLEDWINNIKELTQEGINIGFKQTTDYKKDCVDARLELFQEVVYRRLSYPSKHNLFSITYKDDQSVEYVEFRNPVNTVEEKSYLFEYNPIISIAKHNFLGNRKYTGIFSHKFPFKTGYYKKYLEQILDKEDVDVVIFCKQNPNYLNWSENQHPGLLNILLKICKKLDLRLTNNIPTIYSNFFAAKTEVYMKYVELLKRAIDIMETDVEIKSLVSMDANYKSGLSSTDLKQYTGLDYYTFHTFVLERLIGIWISNNNLTYSVYE